MCCTHSSSRFSHPLHIIFNHHLVSQRIFLNSRDPRGISLSVKYTPPSRDEWGWCGDRGSRNTLALLALKLKNDPLGQQSECENWS